MALLSIAAGLAKVMLVPQELAFLQGFGLNEILVRVFGAVQLCGGVLLLPKKTRLIGAVLVAAGLLTSAVLIFVNGDIIFGEISLVPVLLTGVIIKSAIKSIIETSDI